MCLGIPGKIIECYKNSDGYRFARVAFCGVLKEICLDFVPEAKEGDYVVVHVGFALSKIDEEEAKEVFEYLNKIDQLNEPDKDR